MTGLSVIIVEDQPAKAKKITDAILSSPQGDQSEIVLAENGYDARRFLSERAFDLLILDVVLPNRPNDTPQTEGGIYLLRELMSRDGYFRPKYILGLTAYPEVFHSAAADFADYTWAIIQYEEDSNSWADPIAQILRHLSISSKQQFSTPLDYNFDFCVMTALRDPEFNTLSDLGWDWRELRQEGDPTTYLQAEIDLEGHLIRVVAGCTERMGMVAAAIFCSNMIRQFRPRIMAITGICAGVRGKINIGDVAAADPSWDYQSGKSKVAHFEPAPHQLPLNSAIRRRISSLANDETFRRMIKDNWRGAAPDTNLQFKVGPFASGSAVIASTAALKKAINQQRQMIALDMETYGVYAAAAEAHPFPPFYMSIKGISDFGDEEKNDAFREYAAYTSTALFEAFVTREYLGLKELWP